MKKVTVNLLISFGVLLLAIGMHPKVVNAESCFSSNLLRVKFGERGDAVKNFQLCLIKLGYQIPAGVTGYYGKQTRDAVKEFYRSVMNLTLNGNYIGPQGVNIIKKFTKDEQFQEENALRSVSSKEELRYYISTGTRGSASARFKAAMSLDTALREGVTAAVPLAVGAAGRVSETTIQVRGIDEPDIIKTDGQNIYFAQQERWFIESLPLLREEVPSKILPPQLPKAKTSIIKAFPPESMVLENKIDVRGELLLLKEKKILVIFSDQEIFGYDVSDPKNPQKKWSFKIDSQSAVLSSRLYNQKVYFVTRQFVNYIDPCPLRPLSVGSTPIIVDCLEIYRPTRIIPVDVVFTAFLLDPATGKIEKQLSFVGSNQNSVLYMSSNALYVTYFGPGDVGVLISGAVEEKGKDIFPATLVNRIKQVGQYELGQQTKLLEIQTILESHFNSLSGDERLKLENEWGNRLTQYFKTRKRDFEKTSIVKIGLTNLSIDRVGSVPGYPINQFALDEYKDNLRVAVTVGERSWMLGLFDTRESANDVYVLNQELVIVGKVQDLGLTERIYSARFIADRGYLVTFRQTDPFYVLDLSDPKNPTLKGELKIPGYSSYLQPIAENKILGVGQENNQVKVSLFDAADPSRPLEKDKYILQQEFWSEVLSNHRAFLLDDKHGVFFLPGGRGGYVFSYKNDKLSLVKTVSGFAVKRAVYLDDFLYIISDSKIVVFDERNWEKVKEFEL